MRGSERIEEESPSFSCFFSFVFFFDRRRRSQIPAPPPPRARTRVGGEAQAGHGEQQHHRQSIVVRLPRRADAGRGRRERRRRIHVQEEHLEGDQGTITRGGGGEGEEGGIFRKCREDEDRDDRASVGDVDDVMWATGEEGGMKMSGRTTTGLDGGGPTIRKNHSRERFSLVST